jgi:hypothetical protein
MKWITIIEIDNNGKKTKVWAVVKKEDVTGDVRSSLGHIKWFGAWRKYCFFPLEYTVFEWDCLRDIADFCQEETKKYKEIWYKA